eukprot:5837635-Prymnesium_polylepis.1
MKYELVLSTIRLCAFAARHTSVCSHPPRYGIYTPLASLKRLACSTVGLRQRKVFASPIWHLSGNYGCSRRGAEVAVTLVEPHDALQVRVLPEGPPRALETEANNLLRAVLLRLLAAVPAVLHAAAHPHPLRHVQARRHRAVGPSTAGAVRP